MTPLLLAVYLAGAVCACVMGLVASTDWQGRAAWAVVAILWPLWAVGLLWTWLRDGWA